MLWKRKRLAFVMKRMSFILLTVLMYSRHRAKLNQQPSVEEDIVRTTLGVSIDSLADSLRQRTKPMDPASTWHAIKRFAYLCDTIADTKPSDIQSLQGEEHSLAWISGFLIDEIAGREFTRTRDRSLVRLKKTIVRAYMAHDIFRVALSRYVASELSPLIMTKSVDPFRV